MIAETIPQLKNLSREEKLILVEEIWNELASDPEAFPPREDHIQIVRERMAHFRENPDSASPWNEVKARILGSK
jgi:putative addiction module component (TIGR02574 family)